jgi:hypothetical protein
MGVCFKTCMVYSIATVIFTIVTVIFIYFILALLKSKNLEKNHSADLVRWREKQLAQIPAKMPDK